MKAYYVQRVSRTVTTILVHAESAAAAKREAVAGDGEVIDSESQPRGWGRTIRAYHEDLAEPASGPERN